MNTPPKATLLLVDDNPANLGLLFKRLKKSGYRVLLAQDGKSAIRQAKEDQPDIILLDVMMPEMDGFETCQLLKKEETTQDIPIIFMTALDDTLSKVRGFQEGAVDYVTKPVEYQEVLVRIETHLKIRRLQKNLQLRNEELDAFSHTVAHDLKNPLSLIITYCDLLKEETRLSEKPYNYLLAMSRNAHKMNTIIEELQILASVQKAKVLCKSLNMARIVAEAQQRLSHLIEERGVKLRYPEHWPTALGHAPWVEEVWANYISNAIKYGGDPPRLQLGAVSQSNGMVRFFVRDNGPGLTSEQQKKLFKPFVRLDETRSTGYGLGLSIVRRIVERLGGEVSVVSEIGWGSSFGFTLPAE